MEIFISYFRKVMGKWISNFVAQTPGSFLNYAQRLNPRVWLFYSETLGGQK